MFVAGAAIALAVGVALLRNARFRVLAWLAFSIGLGSLALLVLMQLTGRLGPEHLWFRAPTFYIAAAILASAAVWWLRRPAPPALRFGLPAALLACIATRGACSRGSTAVPCRSPCCCRPSDAPAPELSYFDTTGRKRTLAELQGHVVLLNFWATWCTPCRREMPMLSKLQREHADEGLVVLYVSLEEPEVLAPFLASNHFDGIQGRLDRAAEFYDAGKFYPLSFLIARDGRVAHRWSGRPREDWLSTQIAAQL